MNLKNIPYDLEKYVNPNPVMTIGGVSIVDESSPNNVTERVMKIIAGSGFGFVDIATSKKWFMRVNDKLDYEISFWFKQPNYYKSNFDFSVNAFSCYDIEKTIYESTTGTQKKSFFETGDNIISAANQWYFARYILFGSEKTIEPNDAPIVSLASGNNLIMAEGTTNIIVNILCKMNEIRIFDFKVKPLKTPFSTGFIQGSDILEIWRKNNNTQYSEDKIDSKSNDLLLPYDTSNVQIKLQ